MQINDEINYIKEFIDDAQHQACVLGLIQESVFTLDQLLLAIEAYYLGATVQDYLDAICDEEG